MNHPAPALLALCIPAVAAHAAGGHHSVDDAVILDPGQCQVETWAERERGGVRTLQHAGPNCRVAGIELGLNLDRIRFAGADTLATAGPQVKWAGAVAKDLSVGIVLAAAWQDGSPRYLGETVVLPLTWQPRDGLLLHLNVARFRRAHGAVDNRAGAALEWAPLAQWSVVAERFHENRAGHLRAGLRWDATPMLSVDVSRARRLGAEAAPWWTLGLTFGFER